MPFVIGGRTEGAPERVFDLLFSVSGTGHEKIFWPCLTMLSCITFDRITTDFQYGAPKRKVNQAFDLHMCILN